LEKQVKGDAGAAGVFKIRAYVAAAAAIRDLEYEVESGKACAKAGPKKVKGIGQGIGDMIDEILSTGTLARISELEGGGTDAAAA
jgi:DNA polymerase/3'-5' exonuclease PolX